MRVWAPAAVLALAGCATYFAASQLDERYGKPDPARYDRAAPAAAGEYERGRSVLAHRATGCHGCNDAPCQLSLASYEGVTRGANHEQVYATRVRASEP